MCLLDDLTTLRDGPHRFKKLSLTLTLICFGHHTAAHIHYFLFYAEKSYVDTLQNTLSFSIQACKTCSTLAAIITCCTVSVSSLLPAAIHPSVSSYLSNFPLRSVVALHCVRFTL
jgi:hypothetical protein